MSKATTGRHSNPFKPSGHTLALEPRILFDGAAAVATEQHTDNSNADSADNSHVPASPVEAARSAPAQASAARSLLVIDSRLENSGQLMQQLPQGVKAIVVDTQQDGIAAIEKALETLGQVDSIQILSHGSAGQFTLGSTTVSSDNIEQLGGRIAEWSNNLSAGADIQLYGCKVGAGAEGQTLVNELARWTGADVAASDDDTGSKSAGGDWALEVSNGDIDKAIALSADAMHDFNGLLANASPTASLPSAGADVLLGENFTFTVNFTNGAAGQAGYAPFIDLFFPATGRDGAGAEIDDGVTFVSATYSGQAVTAHVITFDASGKATHPLAVGTNGQALIINAATYGMQAGDQLVVLEVPFADVLNGQPTIGIQVTATLSSLADTSVSNATPDLSIRARGGFQYGNDSLNNPSDDPSLVQTGTAVYTVHPTVVTFDQTIIAPEGETATGPNYGRQYELTVYPANSQTLTDVSVTQPVPNNVIVTAINPGANGAVTSVTLQNGLTQTSAAAINLILARNNDADLSNDLYLKSFTVTYSQLDAPGKTTVDFFVPDEDANGNSILNPITGDDVTITFTKPTASGEWDPLDPRDASAPDGTFTGTGNNVSFTAKSITLLKQVSIETDVGSPGLTPGDTLNYQLNINISDYFAFGKNFFANGSFTIADSLTDGQTLVNGSLNLTLSSGGTTDVIPVVFTKVVNADGSSSLNFDIGTSIKNFYGNRGWLAGDLAFEDVLSKATTAVLSYQAIVGQSYKPPAGNPHSEINEGDSIGNNATVTATILEDSINLTGGDESDSSQTTSTVPTSSVDIKLSDLNNTGAPAPGTELKPGDDVTFNVSYNLVTGDYENFSLTVYLPLPLFDLTGLNPNDLWALATDNSNPNSPSSVAIGPGNSLIFTFANYVNTGVNGSRISIDFSLVVSDEPFADQRAFNVLAESSQTTTLDKTEILSSDDVTLIASVAEPVLNIKHGVVSSSNGTVTGTTGSWAAPGTTGKPFTGSTLTDLASIDGNVNNVDGGDIVRLATAIENSGGGNAYDVSTRITLPNGLSFVGGSLSTANLLIYRGDGTLLRAGTDYTVNNLTRTITFIDTAGSGKLLAGRAGSAADNSGANMVVITYDTVVAANINASATLQSSASLLTYASVEGGDNFIQGAALSDIAGQQVAAPVISTTFAGGTLDNSDSSASHTTGADLVVGESMLYDIKITLPEGVTQTLTIDDLIPPGMRLDTSFDGKGYQLITSAGGVLSANFAGTITFSGLTAVSGTLGADGADARFSFSVASASADNNTANNSFVIRVRLVASNTLDNQANRTLTNDAKLSYRDTDGDTPNGTVAIVRDVASIGTKPLATLREPTLQISQQVTNLSGVGFDRGDTVNIKVTLTNGNAASDFDAFDISFSDALPAELSSLQLTSVIYTVNGVSTDITSSFSLNPTTRQLVNTGNVDIAKGGSVVISVSGVVNATGAAVPDFDNQAQVRWTSLNGTTSGVANPSGERTGQDGTLNGSGILNDYRLDSTLVIPVAQGIRVSRVGGLSDTLPSSPDTTGEVEDAAVGEIIRYRATAIIPEGANLNYQMVITLDAGLTLADLSTIRVGFVSDGGLTSSQSDLITAGILAILGNQDSAVVAPIATDLSGAAPTGVLNSSKYVTVTTDSNGRQVITINFGNVLNADGNDADLEGIVLEFNARVSNDIGNQSGDVLGVVVQDYVGANLRATSNTVSERIVEGGFTNLDKTVTNFNPNTGGTTGTATVTVNFEQTGTLPAYDVNLSDNFPGGTNYTFVSVTIDDVTYTSHPLPTGVTFTTTGGLNINFAEVDIGSKISVVYRVDVPNSSVIANTNASLTWSSLPETFKTWGGSSVGTDGSATGERTGADGVASGDTPLNNYRLVEAAGLGIISGTLWNDSSTPTTAITPDGPGIAGQTVSLVWAGKDGAFGTADDATFTTTTNTAGKFVFGVLPSGLYRINAPTDINNVAAFGSMRMRIDTDGNTLGQVQVSLGESGSKVADSGYVELNDAPVNTLPGTQTVKEDTALNIKGISVSDVDAERDPNTAGRDIQVTLSVVNGTLFFGGATTGVAVAGANTNNVVLVGRISAINAALASLNYQGNANYNGTDQLTVLTNDQGNYGDYNGNGTPGELADALTDKDILQINVTAVNDPPTAVNDTAIAVEAGGTDNRLLGINPAGNLTDNDTDVDLITNPGFEDLNLVSVTSAVESKLVPATGTVVIKGLYGSLYVDISGSYQYIVDNANATVQALRLSSQTLTENFTYVITDQGIPAATANSTARLTVTIQGANDTPVGVDDVATAIEKGGVKNTGVGNPGDTPPSGFPVSGSNATGNVLSNDRDVDSVANGETKTVTGIRAVRETLPGPIKAVPTGGSTPIDGLFGRLTIFANGAYTYVINEDSTAVQRLGPNNSLTEHFSYQVTDTAGLHDLANLTITIKGNYDNPVASDDRAEAQASEVDNDGNESNPIGNVITFPSRPGNATDPGGNGIDGDVDAADRPNTSLVVTGIRNGSEAAGGTLNTVTGATTLNTLYAQASSGTPLANASNISYGQLVINPNGSYSFNVNSDHPDIIALPKGATLDVIVTYQITDTAGLTDTAQLVITVTGANNVPHAQPGVAIATEAGGVNNTTPGVNPTGTIRAADPDGDPLTVTAIRTGAEAGTGTAGTVGSQLRGTYGWLTMKADGSYSYVVDNTLPAVEALREASDMLVERFTYTVTDPSNLSDSAEIFIVIRGQNDNPRAVDDRATAIEQGGVNNSAGGSNPSGNVLTNDRDPDGGEVTSDPIDYGETQAVNAIRTGAVEGSGAVGSLSAELRGNYGWLTLNPDGSYSYRLDNALAAVQALRAGNTLTDSFNYTVVDTDGATDIAVLRVTIQGANDAPVARDDVATAVEAGGVNNATAGSNATGNVLDNDSDVDRYGEKISVNGLAQGTNIGTVGSAFAGAYGSLTLNADGTFTYVVDNQNAAVQALRTASNTLTEIYTYRIQDLAGATSIATLTITIEGRNDAPIAVNDSVTAIEAGGVNNATAGLNPTGNLLANDTDVDSPDNKLLNGIRTGAEITGGSFTNVGASQAIAGKYGTLTVLANGNYSYVVNNALAEVQALKPGDTLREVFTYRMRDTAGATDAAQFVITIEGAWDTPVAANDLGIAVADNGKGVTINPSGNVLTNDSDIDQGDSLTVTAIRTGQERGTGTAGSIGNVLFGQYGTLTINADGTYKYEVDTNNPDVLALKLLETVFDYFTYTTTDQGSLSDTAQLSILVIGRNDPPVAVDDSANAIEAGGLNNSQAGSNPSGNVLGNDTDLESGTLKVTSVRTGSETGSGTAGALGTSLRGLYGNLTLNTNGSWSYVLDNSLAAVQALRISGQTLTETFTYSMQDPYLANDSAELRITIDGRNDTPIAVDDNAIAVEAGGIFNATPGVDPQGNVLDNDTDVDSVANGETKHVLSVSSETGSAVIAGQVLKGRYGSLTLNADGSYQYVLDNSNPQVQALRTAGDTLRETFTYRMSDTAGAESTARLNLLIQGANDTPVAVNDSNVASDQFPAPQTSGNVLPNDSDVDTGDKLQVVGIRTGAESGTGTNGSLGQPLVGRYGTLVLNADGSYTYSIDLTNPDVLAAAGLGQVLSDVFTYTLGDLTGATDLAELVITLDITAPFIPAPKDGGFGYKPYGGADELYNSGLKDVDPAVFVGPVVEANNGFNGLSSKGADGSNIFLSSPAQMQSVTLREVDSVPGQFVHTSVRTSQRESELDLAWILGRQGRIDLTADGLLSDPSLFASGPDSLIGHWQTPEEQPEQQAEKPERGQTASSFQSQLKNAAQQRNPLTQLPPRS